MKVPLRTITVTLSDPEGDAVFKFERLRENERERFVGALNDAKKENGDIDERKMQAAFSLYKKAVLAKCVSVENLFEGDRAVTVEDIRSGNVYTDMVEAVLSGFHAALSQRDEAETKNVPLPPGQSSD